MIFFRMIFPFFSPLLDFFYGIENILFYCKITLPEVFNHALLSRLHQSPSLP